MRLPIAIALIALALPAFSASVEPEASDQVFVLQGGDYNWLPVDVRRVPTAIECHFEAIQGNRTVHVELVSARDFIRYSRHHDYETLATTQPASSGGFRRMIETPGRYSVVIMNDKGALPAAVTLTVRMDVDPPPAGVSKGISTTRQISVIVLSLGLFFSTAFWSGRRLLRAWRRRPIHGPLNLS
jgi:hypothetical protein